MPYIPSEVVEKARKYSKSHLADPLVTKKCVLVELKKISKIISTESKTAH